LKKAFVKKRKSYCNANGRGGGSRRRKNLRVLCAGVSLENHIALPGRQVRCGGEDRLVNVVWCCPESSHSKNPARAEGKGNSRGGGQGESSPGGVWFFPRAGPSLERSKEKKVRRNGRCSKVPRTDPAKPSKARRGDRKNPHPGPSYRVKRLPAGSAPSPGKKQESGLRSGQNKIPACGPE